MSAHAYMYEYVYWVKGHDLEKGLICTSND